MHVCGTGAVRLYIQLAPWRYSTDTFEVGVWIVSETSITNGLHRTALPVDINDKLEYEVHRIKAHHMHHDELQFLTSFKGYNSFEDMWLSTG